MPASITAVQDAILEAINAAAGTDPSTFSLPIAAGIADSSYVDPPAPGADMQVRVAYIGAAQLARTSTRALDQALLNVTLDYRFDDENQTTLDTCHQVAEQMRDVLYGVASSTMRVESLLQFQPFDESMATAGVYHNAIGVDLDVLRELTTPTEPTEPSTSPRLTAIRQAVIDAIQNWSPFTTPSEVWNRVYASDEDQEELWLHDPGLQDLPAIAVNWGNVGQNWWTHIEQKWPATLNVSFWLPAHQISTAEWRAQQVVQAVYQAAATGNPLSYIRAATGYPPDKYSQSIEAVVLGRGQNKAVRGTIAFTLPATFQPYGSPI